MDTSVDVAVLTKEGADPVRLVYQLFYSVNPATKVSDRGPIGYEIHTDGRVIKFVNAEVAGMSKDDDPERYQERLEQVAQMLADRRRDLEKTHEAPKPRTIRARLGQFVREILEA